MNGYGVNKRGRALRIAIVTLLVFSVFMGGAGALSDAAVSDNVWDNYPDIAGSNGNFPDHPHGTPTLHSQLAEQFFNPAGAGKMAVQTVGVGQYVAFETVVEKLGKSR